MTIPQWEHCTRAKELDARGVHYLGVGTSGGVWGFDRSFCKMHGGDAEAASHLDPVFKTLAPGRGDISRMPGRETPAGTAEEVKMVHIGIEYGLMETYAEGLNIPRHARVGKQDRTVDAETTPLRNPEHYLTATALFGQHDLLTFSGRVSDSGKGRWTITAPIEEAAPAPVLSAALCQRFASRGEEDFADIGGRVEEKL